jgi:hypothetical protein
LLHLPHHRAVILLCYVILKQPINERYFVNLGAVIQILISCAKFNHFSFFMKKKFQLSELLGKIIEYQNNNNNNTSVNEKIFENIKKLINLINDFRC